MNKMNICQQVRANIAWLSNISFDDFGSIRDEEAMAEIGNSMPYPMGYSCGCTQGCFVSPNYNAVIKFEIDDSERACYYSLLKYQIAEEMGVAEILLPLESVGASNDGINLYIQPKFSSAHCDLSWSMSRKYNRQNDNVKERLAYKVIRNCYDSRLCRAWVESALRVYGKKFMRRFEEFTCRCEVNDLHQANVGYIGNRPVIIDYAGYCTGWEGE